MVDETRKCIRDGMISLLQEKHFSEIQMIEIAQRANIGRRTLYRYFENKDSIAQYMAESLMDGFAAEIEKENPLTLGGVVHAFYTFIQKNRTELVVLKKSRLLGYIEERLPELIVGVAAKTKYKDKPLEEVPLLGAQIPAQDKYFLHFVIAGCWRVAMVWIAEDEKLTSDQMADITVKILTGIV